MICKIYKLPFYSCNFNLILIHDCFLSFADMYEQVLKYGSYIVDGLCECKQPVMVYIPPFAELRGGAWAVLDPTINSKYMEMYADQDCRWVVYLSFCMCVCVSYQHVKCDDIHRY